MGDLRWGIRVKQGNKWVRNIRLDNKRAANLAAEAQTRQDNKNDINFAAKAHIEA